MEQNEEEVLENFDDIYSQEEETLEIPQEVRKINTQAYDKSVADVVRMMNENDINLNPEYQRNYIWDNKRASLLIESIILNVPIPVIYVAQEKDDSWTVIDGLQRLNSIKRFFERDFKLSGLDILSELNKSDVKSLNPKALRVLKNGLLRIIVISHDSHEEIKYDVFMRLNRGAVKLNEQELRNCLYRGGLNQLLKEMAENPDFLALLKLKTAHKRMMDCELILRFLALNGNWNPETGEIEHYKGRMKSFLNQFMIRNQNPNEERLDYYKNLFDSTADKVLSVVGNQAFRRVNLDGETESALNRAIMDCLMVSFARFDKEMLLNKKEEINQKLRDLFLNDDEFRDSVTIGTSDQRVITYRLQRWYDELTAVLNG
ncbi:MAG: hypothetical protein CML16_00145 [Pusillimonas sp.]|nr:hypothetical protein [Pusillimonas sp.]|tara:strand:- start:17628 stop:18749 length:1122 start_codon:yes stop_codon:yes gene_type:complete